MDKNSWQLFFCQLTDFSTIPYSCSRYTRYVLDKVPIKSVSDLDRIPGRIFPIKMHTFSSFYTLFVKHVGLHLLRTLLKTKRKTWQEGDILKPELHVEEQTYTVGVQYWSR